MTDNFYEREVLEALQKGTTAAVEPTALPDTAVKYINRVFNTPDDGKWLEIVHIPNNPDDQYWGEERNYIGIFRLILHWPNDDAGAYEAIDLLGEIVGHFVKGMSLQNVKISGNPDLTAVLEGPKENMYPCSIRYQCFRP